MSSNPLRQLQALGQSVWLDYIRRDLIESNELRRLVEEDGVRGITSIRNLALHGQGAMAIYQALTQGDIRRAADELRPVYDSTEAADGYASLEVNPHLAHDARATVEEARSLWTLLDRPNVMIKVPATPAGLNAIRKLVSEGINVNATLIFGVARYREAAQAYIEGLEARAERGEGLRRVASVASFFVSRIDQLVDPLLEMIGARAGELAQPALQARGQVAIASAKCAYAAYCDMFGSERFARLSAQGACTQRLLWASTGTGNPEYPDTKYVEALVGAETVSTLPLATLEAYRDHGNAKARLVANPEEASRLIGGLARIGISIEGVALQLEREAIENFTVPFDQLLVAISRKARSTIGQAALPA